MEPTDDVRHLRRLLTASDATQALQASVDFTVAALGCAVSWAGLARDEYLVMGAHQGLSSTEMPAAWRLKIGDGIGGRAALERRPFASNYYQHDSRRVPLMKRVIDNEGIAATLVVPILAGDQILGVIYAAHREPHAWSAAEQRALTEIAEDLAVRLRHFDIEGESARRAQLSQAAAAQALSTIQQCGDLAERLLSGSDLNSALDAAAGHLDARIELRRTGGETVYATGRSSRKDRSLRRELELQGPGELELSIAMDAAKDEIDEAEFDLVCALVRMQLMRVTERERTIEQLKGELLDQLLSGRVSDIDSMKRRLALIGMSYPHGALLAVVGARGDEPLPSHRFQEVLRARFRRCITTEREGRLVVLVDLKGSDEGRIVELLSSLMTREDSKFQHLMAGIGRLCHELIDYSMSYNEARAAWEFARHNPAGPRVVTARELGIQGLASLPTLQLHRIVRDSLGELIDSDTIKGTDFVVTLSAYLRNDRHLPSTSAELHVHYNTVRNRIGRIEELLGVDLRDVDARFRLETALRMQSVILALTEDAVTT